MYCSVGDTFPSQQVWFTCVPSLPSLYPLSLIYYTSRCTSYTDLLTIGLVSERGSSVTVVSGVAQSIADLLVAVVTWRTTYHAHKAQPFKMFGRSLTSVVLYDGESMTGSRIYLAHPVQGSIYVVYVLLQHERRTRD